MVMVGGQVRGMTAYYKRQLGAGWLVGVGWGAGSMCDTRAAHATETTPAQAFMQYWHALRSAIWNYYHNRRKNFT